MESSSSNFGIPPPPPPPVKGQLPTARLPTQLPAEAPACVQNAMMTKDKKPFTYTPGGIDLSQIKSPRMAKRVQKNAMSEGVTGPPKVSPLAQPNHTQNPGQSQVDMGKFAGGMPFQVLPPPPPPPPAQQPTTPKTPTSNGNSAPRNHNQPRHFEPPPMGFRPEIKIPQNPMANLKPTPRPQPQDDFWVEEYKQEKAASVEPQPQRAVTPVAEQQRPATPGQASPPPPTPPPKSFSKTPLTSLYIPQPGQEDRQQLLTQLSPPWMSSKSPKPDPPEWAHRDEGERMIPIQIDRSPRTPVTPNLGPQPFYGVPSPALGGHESPSFGHVNPSQPQYSPQYNHPNQYVHQGYQNLDYARPSQPFSPTPQGTRVIPIRVEGMASPVSPGYRGPNNQSPVIIQSDPRSYTQQQAPMGWGNNQSTPTQSRSFKMLQRITDSFGDCSESEGPRSATPTSGFDETDNRMRRMKLSEDDQRFMSSVKSQVDEERYLHKEEDPRYRGAAIPSKAFRFLQSQINEPEAGFSAPINRSRGRAPSRQDYEQDEGPPKPYVPPSEQQVYEPKKYTGANIPSRSFRLLQAMTQSDNPGPGQSDM